MLQHVSEHIRECHGRAEQARRSAAETSDPDRKADYELAEKNWLRLADSYALSERLECYLLGQDAKIARRGEWLPAGKAPFNCDLEIAVIKSATPHAVAFPCRRILGGWMDAQTKERLKVNPTHWREWCSGSAAAFNADALRAPSPARPREYRDQTRLANDAIETRVQQGRAY